MPRHRPQLRRGLDLAIVDGGILCFYEADFGERMRARFTPERLDSDSYEVIGVKEHQYREPRKLPISSSTRPITPHSARNTAPPPCATESTPCPYR